jgi:hypothetical protein
MKKKIIIELFIYVIVVVVGIALLITSKPDKNPIKVNSDFKVGEQRGYSRDSVFVQQSEH